MLTAMQNLDRRAQAIVDAQRALTDLNPGQEALPGWFRSWNELKFGVQSLWLEQIVAQHTRSDQEETEALHRRFSEDWLREMERLDGELQRQALASGLADLHPRWLPRWRKNRSRLRGSSNCGLRSGNCSRSIRP
ncbi:geranylgeranyl pyrophosphate synthase [Deinococcus grandis]|uniref:Geranylgeranyl pyrophosphate synthase n=1 Tax=Deinococcus grandis TaxID=57498 RepID=A0A100HQH0_9DEIO|nr:hypothetical protein [Deinococcus grandis]BBN96861.1 hypothetical protein DEGR_35940 [Deinococcus grandis]GAQ23855.1 geranylgeranyl pyrophosphate synthase [Deinococcus grandis]